MNTRIGIRTNLPSTETRPREPERKDGKVETKDGKVVRGGTGAQARGPVQGRAKPKDANATGVEGLLRGSDQWDANEEESGQRKRRAVFLEEAPLELKDLPEDYDPQLGLLENLPAEFRDQMAGALVQARSFTKGGPNKPVKKKKKRFKMVPIEVDDDDEEIEFEEDEDGDEAQE